ncbi:MAG: L,D-transpeptidase family protein [Pseudomonadota bacterium]
MGPGDLRLTPTGMRFGGRRFPANHGRGGIVDDKREGDGGTPRGAHRIVGALYRPDRLVRPVPWAEPIGPRDLWSDDPSDPAYNRRVRTPHRYRHEALRRADPMYDLILVTDWNWRAPEAGRGSAIFVHAWRGRGKPTAGCVALRCDHLFWIAQRLELGARLIVR